MTLILIAAIVILVYCVIRGYDGATLSIDPHVICPHCGRRGTVSTGRRPHGASLSASRAAAAGPAAVAGPAGAFSMLATAFSRRIDLTAAQCIVCERTWTI